MKLLKSVFVFIFFLALAVLVVSFKETVGGTVRGTINPPDASLRAFLFSGKDTLSANVVNGAFQFSNVAAGNYSILLQASPPYRNTTKEGIRVIEGEFTDAGQIELQRQ